MGYVAHIVGQSPVRLWHLDAETRLRRQLRQAGNLPVVEDLDELGPGDRVLLVRADHLFEVRTLTSLIERDGEHLLRHPGSGVTAAAVVGHQHAQAARAALTGEGAPPAGATLLEPSDLEAFDHQLRKSKPPLLEPVSTDRRAELEALLYGTAYKGITDLVTKLLFPRPARHAVRACAAAGITPNMVTVFSLALMLWVCWLFAHGHFAVGLAAGWLMTFLDTVDGKLARVTVQSSRFGHVLDHGMDLIHPPFWYYLWGVGLVAYQPVLGLSMSDLMVLIVAGYVGGRAAEGAFHLLGDASIFSWRPFDAYFRLITGRRNPCLILLTAGLIAGRPDWGLVAVALWTAGTTLILFLRLAQGAVARLRGGPLTSFLTEPGAATRYAHAYRMFSGTQSAYAAR